MANEALPTGNGAAAILQMLQALGGTKTTQTVSANTAPLQQILAQLQGTDYTAILEQIFRQASGQIPRLQAAYANASGARSGGNSGAALALEKLLADVTKNSTLELAKLQQANTAQQIQAAGGIAQGSQKTTTTQGANTSQAAKNLAAIKLLSSLAPGLQKVGKKVTDLFGGGSMDQQTLSAIMSSPLMGNQTWGDLISGGAGFGSLPTNSFDFSGAGTGNFDFGFDLLSGASTPSFDFSSAIPALDFGSTALDLAPVSFGDFTGSFGDLGGGTLATDMPQLDVGSFSTGNGAAGTLPEVISGGLEFVKDAAPFLGAATYLVEPDKLGNALELGEGNVAMDVAQIANLGSAIGGVAGALELGGALGSLAGATSWLGPLGLIAGGLAAAFTETPDWIEDVKSFDKSYLDPARAVKDKLGSSDLMFPNMENWGWMMNSAEAANGNLKSMLDKYSGMTGDQYAKEYFDSFGKRNTFELADWYLNADKRAWQYVDPYISKETRAVIDARQAGKSWRDLITDTTDQSDRTYAYVKDYWASQASSPKSGWMIGGGRPTGPNYADYGLAADIDFSDPVFSRNYGSIFINPDIAADNHIG